MKKFKGDFYIAIVDDEPDIRNLLYEILNTDGYNCCVAKNYSELEKLISLHKIGIIFLDIFLKNENGLDILKEIKNKYPEIEVVIITGQATIDNAIKAIKLGAFDFISKPLNYDHIITTVNKVLNFKSLKEDYKKLKEEKFLPDEFIGEDESIIKIKELIKIVAKSDSKVIIFGENGTGKELVARLIHLNSDRFDKNFVEINCAAIPPTLIESELFGYEKGSFTNAYERKIGKFEMADKGTLFLDEIGDMSLDTQVKLLRVIQDGRFARIGGLETIEVDVRIISATNKDLEKEIKNGNFREDLFYRLNVIPIYLPPLRERKKDIKLIIDYFLNKLKEKGELRFENFSKDALDIILNYNWPGNIRELKNFIERVNIFSTSKIVDVFLVKSLIGNNKIVDIDDLIESEKSLEEIKKEIERKVIIARLKKFNGNVSLAAKSLGIDRTGLYKKAKILDIKIEKEESN
ncbi:MAG: sigma-54 dependent transcriptional regulator [Spirochaetes bacterium]|nr:sigma-54 dependent transcriptional regulator [Spirochaetota bacterium]